MGILTESELSGRIGTLLRADDFGRSSWHSSSDAPLTVTYRFEVSQTSDFPLTDVGGGFEAFSSAETQAFRSVLDKLSDFLNIEFVEIGAANTDDAVLSFYKANDLYTNNPDSTGGGRAWWSFLGSDWDGYAVFNTKYDLSQSNYTDLIMHEIGHALGLKHPGDYDAGGNNPVGPFLPTNEDNSKYSVMSYVDAPDGTTEPNSYMLYDYAALQKWWGADISTRAGNDTYSAASDNELYVVWDGGGVDTLQAGSATSVTLDLREGAFSSINGVDNVVIAYDVTIEQAQGSSGNDTLIGSEYDNVLTGLDGNDVFTGNGGSDTINGGSGTDTAIYSGTRDFYSVEISAAGTKVSDHRLTGDGNDQLTSIEQLDFSGSQDVSLSLLAGVANNSAAELTIFVEMYIAYFNRAPDAEGLFYWGTRLSEGMSLPDIATSFFVQPETVAQYPNPDDTAGFVNAVYSNVLGRTPDASGFAYWVSELDTGSVSRPVFMLAIINGAKAASGSPDDVAYITAKAQIGSYFSVTKGMSDVNHARDAMQLFDGSDTSLASAKTAIDGYYDAAIDPANSEFLINLVGVLDDPFAIA